MKENDSRTYGGRDKWKCPNSDQTYKTTFIERSPNYLRKLVNFHLEHPKHRCTQSTIGKQTNHYHLRWWRCKNCYSKRVYEWENRMTNKERDKKRLIETQWAVLFICTLWACFISFMGLVFFFFNKNQFKMFGRVLVTRDYDMRVLCSHFVNSMKSHLIRWLNQHQRPTLF